MFAFRPFPFAFVIGRWPLTSVQKDVGFNAVHLKYLAGCTVNSVLRGILLKPGHSHSVCSFIPPKVSRAVMQPERLQQPIGMVQYHEVESLEKLTVA